MTTLGRARLRAVGVGAALGLFAGLLIDIAIHPGYDGRVLLAALALAAAAALADTH